MTTKGTQSLAGNFVNAGRLAAHSSILRSASHSAVRIAPFTSGLSMMLKSAFLSLSVAAVFGSPARAEMSAQTFLQNYDQAPHQQKWIYERILGSAENGMSWVSAAVVDKTDVYCPPKNLALADQQDLLIMRQYIEKHQDKRNLPYGLVLLLALKETFPCK